MSYYLTMTDIEVSPMNKSLLFPFPLDLGTQGKVKADLLATS